MQDMKLLTPNYRLIGHRGAADVRPENTLCAFEYAAQAGLNWIEFDIQLTSDKQWVVLHDETLERTSNGQGALQDYSLAEVRKLDAGSWFSPQYAGQQIPTLTEVLDLALKLNLTCNIELKSPTVEYALAFTQFVQQRTALPPILLSSFDHNCVAQLQEYLPAMPRAYVIEQFDDSTLAAAQALAAYSVHCCVNKITAAEIALLREHGFAVLLYTINDAAVAAEWLQQGIYAIFTDQPSIHTHN